MFYASFDLPGIITDILAFKTNTLSVNLHSLDTNSLKKAPFRYFTLSSFVGDTLI